MCALPMRGGVRNGPNALLGLVAEGKNMRVLGFWISAQRHPHGLTRAGLYFLRLRGVGGFMAGLNAPLLGDCCIDVRRVA